MKANKTNLGYLFTKDYFRMKVTKDDIENIKKYVPQNKKDNNDKKKIKENDPAFSYKRNDKGQWIYEMNNDVIQARSKNLTAIEYEAPDQPAPGNQSFELTTVYPGLLVGSGYMHDLKQEKAFKLGFYFDHTTGFPVIPGSSVKGVLRSAFKYDNGNYLKELLKTISSNKIDVSELENVIFEGTYKGENLLLYQRDIFFDAFPVKTQNRDKKFLANDYITPHTDGPLKDPKPLQFLKVLPQVSFKFEFILHDFKNENGDIILTAEDKLKLFKRILLDLGVGAKTNVGYGQFVDPQKPNVIGTDGTQGTGGSAPGISPIPVLPLDKVKKGTKLKAEVVERKGKIHKLKLFVQGYNKLAEISYNAGIEPGKKLLVVVNNIQGKGKKKTLQVGFVNFL